MSEICNNQNRDNQGKEQGVCDMGERVKTGNGLKLAMTYVIAALFPVTIILLSIGFIVCMCKSPETLHPNWLCLVFKLTIMVLLIVACVIMFVKFIKHLDKLSEQDAKYKERLTDEAIRILKEDEEYKRLDNRAQINLLEKQGRAIMDEEVRAKEHQRKLDVMDRERIADLNDKVLEIVKAQITSTTFDEKSTQQWIKELIQTISNLSSKIK